MREFFFFPKFFLLLNIIIFIEFFLQTFLFIFQTLQGRKFFSFNLFRIQETSWLNTFPVSLTYLSSFTFLELLNRHKKSWDLSQISCARLFDRDLGFFEITSDKIWRSGEIMRSPGLRHWKKTVSHSKGNFEGP